jgi:hypothetical protein
MHLWYNAIVDAWRDNHVINFYNKYLLLLEWIYGLACLNWLWPESKSLYDWRFTANKFVLATSLLRFTTSNFIFQVNICGYSPYVTFSLTITWVSRLQSLLVLASEVILRYEFHPHFTLSDSRLPQPGGPGPRIYIPQEQGGPVIPPMHWVPFSLPPTTRRATLEAFQPHRHTGI